MKPLARERLDQMGCSWPGCDHSAHEGLVMHGRCHMDAGSHVRYKDDAIHVTCSVCDDLIAVVAVSEIELLYHVPQDEKPGLPLHGCCDGSAWVTYEKGYAHVTCTKCNSPLAMCVVKDDRPPLAKRAKFLWRGGPL